MHTTQTTLSDDDHPTTDASHERATTRESTAYTTLAPADQRGGDECCPWCLAAADTFDHHNDGAVGCGHCDASIPVGIPWFERGEKIVV